MLLLLPTAFAVSFDPDPWWSAGPPAGSGSFGLALALGDFTADGVPDVVVGGPRSGSGDDWSGEYQGALYLYDGVSGATPAADPSVEWSPGEWSLAGSVVTTLGDVDGDGVDDLASTGTHGASFDGVVYLVYGGEPWAGAVTELASPWPGAQFASALTGAGDVDGDGYRDLLAGAYGAEGDDGAAGLFAGGPTGIAATPAWTVTGPVSTGLLGYNVTALGDFDSDGFADICVGGIDAVTDGDWAGVAYLYAGSAAWPGAATQMVMGDATVHSELGCPVAGDFDTDGFTDLAFPEPSWYRDSTRVGRIRLAEWDGATFVDGEWFEGPFVSRTQTMFSRGLDVADLDGDGFDDLVATAYRAPDTASGEGIVYAWTGGVGGLDSAAPTTWAPGEENAYAGKKLAHPADMDGDGLPDLLISIGATSALPDGGVLILRVDPGDGGTDTGVVDTGVADTGVVDTGDSAVDSGETGTVDTGDSAVDSGETGTVDTGDSAVDSGETGAVDTGDSDVDSGDSAIDTGDSAVDTGDSAVDTGDSAVDTGDSASDTGDSAPDTGDSAPDTGDSAPDTGDSAPDSGDTDDTAAESGDTSSADPPDAEGCAGCAGTGSPPRSVWLTGGLAAALLARRRRR